MADVTGGDPPIGSSEFNPPLHFDEVYQHFGAPDMFAVANAAALPASGNWPGRTLMTDDTKTLYMWTGSAWIVVNGGVYSVSVASPQSIPNATLTDVVFTGGTAATAGPTIFSAVLATGVVTVAVAGLYRIRGKVVWASGGTADSHVLGVSINNAANVEAVADYTNVLLSQNVEYVGQLAASDTVRLKVLHVSGAAKNIFVPGGNYLTRLSIERLS